MRRGAPKRDNIHDSATLLSFDWLTPIELEPVMALYTFYRLSQTACSSMLMVRTGSKMRMKDDNCSRLRIARTVQAPVVTGVIGFDGYIIDILVDNGKIV